jgi:hypothetical protein
LEVGNREGPADDINEERAYEEGYRFVDRGAATHRIEIDAAIDADRCWTLAMTTNDKNYNDTTQY